MYVGKNTGVVKRFKTDGHIENAVDVGGCSLHHIDNVASHAVEVWPLASHTLSATDQSTVQKQVHAFYARGMVKLINSFAC